MRQKEKKEERIVRTDDDQGLALMVSERDRQTGEEETKDKVHIDPIFAKCICLIDGFPKGENGLKRRGNGRREKAIKSYIEEMVKG